MEATQVEQYPVLKNYLEKNNDPQTTQIVETIFLCGQDVNIFYHLESLPNPYQKLDEFIESLRPVEHFYDVLGGLKSYHNLFLSLRDAKCPSKLGTKYLLPRSIDISIMDGAVQHAIRKCIENMGKMAEIYPVGGAGERFNLKDPETQEPLPIGALLFRGHTLLEGLIRDLQAKEYLCFKLKKHQVISPVAMMTSNEKHNHQKITEILENNRWFGRKDKFKLFVQPLVPVITEEGDWVQDEPLHLCMKPGGHGVIWKMAHDSGVFDWFKEHKVSKALVRQINNPIAGTDYGLLAFAGIGIERNKQFGFAACPRVVNAAEGMNVLIEHHSDDDNEFKYTLSNVEYTNFEKEGIKDIPREPGSRYSAYPCNTNLLFIDIPAVNELCLQHPLPGLLINLKTTCPVLQKDGSHKNIKVGRIETTMQNISDYMIHSSSKPLEDQDVLPQYITYNERVKTISVTKHQYVKGECFDNTPESASKDLSTLHRDLLTNYCGFILPPEESIEEYLSTGPAFYFDYHPALGPLYNIIASKLKRGKLAHHSELILEIPEIEATNLNIDGSFIVKAHDPFGHQIDENSFLYSNNGGKCTLRNVTVLNKGIDREKTLNYWNGTPIRQEECVIEIEGDGEFHAENAVFTGPKAFFVPAGHRLIIKGDTETMEKINSPTWFWEYQFDEDDTIKLARRAPAKK